jgi:signal transduction histidine kinase
VLLAKTLRSSTLRLALIWIGIFGTAVAALLGYVYWSSAAYMLRQSDQALAMELVSLREAYTRGGRDQVIAAIAQRIAGGHSESGIYLLADPSGAPLAGNHAAWPASLKGSSGWGNFSAPDWKLNAVRRAPLRATFETLPDNTRLLVGKDIEELDQVAERINTALLLTALLIVAVAGAASASITRRTVGRIESINATSRAIMQSGLSERIPLRGTKDEWDELATNLNSMLDRIETLMGEVKQFTDNVAHELRTPITRLRGRLEKSYNSLREGDAHKSMIGDTIADLDSVRGIFSSLTRISQIEATDRTAAFRTIDLAEIVREVVELFDAAAEEKGGQLNTLGDQRVLVTGDRDLLFDAVANLVDNAIKHGPEAGRVTVDVRQSDAGAAIAVSDEGPGIPGVEIRNVFKHRSRRSTTLRVSRFDCRFRPLRALASRMPRRPDDQPISRCGSPRSVARSFSASRRCRAAHRRPRRL